ncbi:MAG: hypothetical protein ACI8PZ_004930 [Myxococcota bacterium]|jgi:hypothetical protein
MLTTLLALSLAVANAQDLRDIRGRSVDLDATPTAVLQWSLDCRECTAELVQLARTGVRVVAVSSDPAQKRSALTPYLRARGVAAVVVSDPDGRSWERVMAGADMAPGDAVVWRGTMSAGEAVVAAR